MLRIISAIILSIAVTSLFADLRVTLKSGGGQISTITTNGQKARMDDPQDPSYVVANYASGQFNVVNLQEQEVLVMSSADMPVTSEVSASSVDIRLEKRSKGPTIAGYKTREYALTANGRHCATIFGSKKMLKKAGISGLFEFMGRMQQQSHKMMGAYRGTMDVCTQATQQLSQSYQTTGAPLRLLDETGKLESEVIKIKTDEKTKPGYYSIPAGFNVIIMKDKMNAASQQSQQMMEQMGGNMPDMNELMQQFQGQGDEIPEEAMEKLKQMQEMFKQYQQQ